MRPARITSSRVYATETYKSRSRMNASRTNSNIPFPQTHRALIPEYRNIVLSIKINLESPPGLDRVPTSERFPGQLSRAMLVAFFFLFCKRKAYRQQYNNKYTVNRVDFVFNMNTKHGTLMTERENVPPLQ